jgi:broad specificity phosphatase PhoE
MTKQEHETMILMLARAYQTIGALANVLKSREIMTDDDLKAFQFAAWADDRQTLHYVSQARADYLKAAQLSGVEGLPDL